ncbi:phosphatidylinositol phosphatase PTPRQ-like isoform X3 [Oscarella lobularis]|uniref:phosphatidylinositol phosphatase PTPRQ-like isoform X3 n=1 Tax=Oscarella lobularis TaxID=121494 RepID=UPI003313D104
MATRRIHYAIIVALLHAFAATESRNLCPNDIGRAIDSSVSSYCRANVQNYSRLLVDKASGKIAVAAKANLMVLPLDLDKTKAINFTKLATTLEKTLCQLDFSDPEKCENYFRVLLKDRQSPNIFVCSTNANNPKCAYYNITDLSVVNSNWASSSYPVCPGDPSASNTALMTINAGNNIDVVVGSEKDGKYLVGKYRPPNFQIHSPLSDVNYLNSPDVKFISSHEVGEHVFLFLRETALEAWSQYTYSRVIRVCKDDLGDSTFIRYNWKTFLKARISCTVSAGSPAYHYDRLVATSYIKNAVYTPTATVQDVVYAVFTGSPGSPSGSAVCVFGFNGTYQGDFSKAYGSDYWVTNSDGLWLTDTKTQFTCSTPKQSADEFNYILVSTDVQQATSGRPLATINGATATSLAVDRVKTADGVDYDVLFVGFDDGSVRKIVQVRDGASWKEKIVETIAVDVDNAVIQLELLDDANPSQRKVYALTEKKVASLSVERCDRLNTCKECIEAQDPYCGWSSSLSSCLALGSGVVQQDVRAGNYTRFCPKAPADYLVSVDYSKSTSYSLFFLWNPISVPPSPYSIPSFRLYQDGVNIANVSSSVTSYNLTSLLPHTEYTFSILPVNNFGEGEESNIVSVTTHIADSVLLRGSAQQPKEIALAWEKPLITNGPLSKYKVYSAESGQSLTLASTLSHPHIIKKRLNYTDTSLKPETTYVYQVESCTEDSNGEFCSKSNSISVETPCDYPSAPPNVIASALNSSSIRLQWSAPSTPNGRLLGYRIRKDPRGEYVSSSSTSIVVSDLISFTNYTFTVAALTCVGYGPSSLATASRTLPAPPPKPETPRLLPSTSDQTIAVNWTPPSRVEGSIQNFILCRSPGSCQTFSSSTTSYVDANVSPCVEYEYTVAVRSDGGDGEASDVTSAFIIGYSNNVTSVRSSVQSSSEIAITWDAPSPRNGLCHVEYYSILQDGIQISNASFTSYFASGLSSATSYVFRVASATAAGVSSYAEIRATTLPSRPAQPTSLNSKIISGGVIQLTWAEPNPNYGNPTNYHVYELFGGNRRTVSSATTSFDIPSDWTPIAGQTYSFYVTAENGAGEGSAAKVDVDVGEKIPGKPAGIYAMATGKTTARVAWLPPAWNELNGQITGYKIEQVKPAPIRLVKEVPGMATTTLDVTSLTAGTVYAFRVSAKNGAGYGTTITSVDMETEKDLPTPVPPTCRPTIITVNPPSAPAPPVPTSTSAPGPATTKPPSQGVSASITATAVSSLEMSVTWTINKPENNVQRIVINRRRETAGLTWTSYVEKCCNGNFQLAFRDNTLSPYTKYEYSLDVFMNDGSIHKNLASDQARTHPAAPAAPKNLRFSAVATTTVTLTWDVPQPENGIVSEYDVTLDSFPNTTTTKQRTAIIGNLKPYTIYGFRVRAVTTSHDGNQLNGEFSQRYEIRTATAPPEKLPAPIVVAASTTSVFLSWSQPTILTGIVTGYRFYWHEKTGAACPSPPSSRENYVEPSRDIESRRQLNDVVTDLKVDTGYCFAVVAKTSAGYGTLSDYASVTTFSLASLGENVSCPNIDLLRNYIDQLILTPAPPPTTSRQPTTFGTVVVEEVTSPKSGNTVVIILGVVAGLAVITTLVLGILLVIYCHRGGFSVSDFVGDSDGGGGGGGTNDVDGQTSKKNLLNGDAHWARRVSTETGPVGAPVAPRTLPPLKGAPRAPSGLYEPVITRTTSKLATSGSKSAEADKAGGLDQTSM